ncbi:MAG: ABC transporter substrate-binding protein [Caldisericia bacterium]
MKKFTLLIVCFILVLSFVSCGNPNDVSIVDDLGEEIIIDDSPQRIVSLTPNITEILFYLGVGDKVVARTSFCNFPPEVESIPTVGDMMNLSLESILGFEPDLVIANRMVPMEILDGLKGISSRRIVVAAFDPNSIESLFDSIDRIAQICHVPSKTKSLEKELKKITPLESKQ